MKRDVYSPDLPTEVGVMSGSSRQLNSATEEHDGLVEKLQNHDFDVCNMLILLKGREMGRCSISAVDIHGHCDKRLHYTVKSIGLRRRNFGKVERGEG